MKIKKTYVLTIILLVLTIMLFYTSYAFFTDLIEQHGKLNIVVGDLTYKLVSDDLENNQITVASNEIKEITVKLFSLNDISSKYELYYTLDKTNSNLRIGYSIDTKDSVLGTIDANSSKTITIVIRNESDTDSKITFSTIGGLTNNDLTLTKGNSLNQVVGKYTAYNIGDEITLTDGSKWHVLEASDEIEESVVLLSDYNLNTDGTYNTTCGMHIDGNVDCNTMAFDTDDTSIYDEEDSNNIGYFIKYTYEPLVIEKFPEATNITLPTGEQIVLADGKTKLSSYATLDSEWLLYTSYWTKSRRTSIGENRLWRVYPGESDTFSSTGAVYSHHGARPTITVPKKYIVDTISSTTELAIGTSVEAIDGSKWHVLEASSSDSKYVTLLSDYNLNSDGSYNTECGGEINSTYKCSPMAFDEDNTSIYDESDSNNIGYFIKNTYEPKVTSALFETTNVTLSTADQIVLADGQTFNNQYVTLTSSWLITTNYWTQTTPSSVSSNVWAVTSPKLITGTFGANTSSSYGARPVITTLKSNLLTK